MIPRAVPPPAHPYSPDPVCPVRIRFPATAGSCSGSEDRSPLPSDCQTSPSVSSGSDGSGHPAGIPGSQRFPTDHIPPFSWNTHRCPYWYFPRRQSVFPSEIYWVRSYRLPSPLPGKKAGNGTDRTDRTIPWISVRFSPYPYVCFLTEIPYPPRILPELPQEYWYTLSHRSADSHSRPCTADDPPEENCGSLPAAFLSLPFLSPRKLPVSAAHPSFPGQQKA